MQLFFYSEGINKKMHRKCFPQTCRRALIAVKNMTRFDKYILHSAHLFDYFEHVYQLY